MIYKAVWGMVKNGSLARKQMKKLRIFNQAEHARSSETNAYYYVIRRYQYGNTPNSKYRL